MQHAIRTVLAVVILCVPTCAFGALASQSTGKAVTSAHLSTNPTIRKQQLLVDPDERGVDGEPLMLAYARLDVLVQFDLPIGVNNAQDIIQSIEISPMEPYFQPEGPQPFYNGPDNFFNVSFDGALVLISDLTMAFNIETPPPPGEIVHAIVDVQYNDLLPFDIYKNIVATYTVQPGSQSLIIGMDSIGTQYRFGPQDIIPATASESLGVPEPSAVGALMLGLLSLKRRRASRAA